MVELDASEVALLKRAAKGKLAVTVRDRGIVLATGSEQRHVAEGLVRRGHLRFEGYADDKTGFEIALYGITTSGRACVEIVTGRFRLAPEDRGHPGCC